MAQARADLERLPAVPVLVQRALEHAGLADTFRLLPDVDEESAARGAKSYPETSAQHHALWAAIMASMIGKKPTEAQRYINAAEATAALALAAPLAMPTETGIKALQETTDDDGRIGLLLSAACLPRRPAHARARTGCVAGGARTRPMESARRACVYGAWTSSSSQN